MCAALIATAAIVPASQAASQSSPYVAPHYKEYVALGDSWSADVFTQPPLNTKDIPIDCAQSVTNYPHQVAAFLGITDFRDATCGSAVTDNMAGPQPDLPLGGTNPPQFDRLTKTTDLVTLGIGGNDVGIAADVEDCLSAVPVAIPGLPEPLGPCKDRFVKNGVDTIQLAVKATAPKIAKVIAGIKARSPKAHIFLVNYLNGLPLTGVGCWPIVPVQNVDVAYLQAKFLQMNAMLAQVAKATHITLVDTYTPTIGHDVCQAPTIRYVEGLVPVSANTPTLAAFPFHPNQAGADAQARVVLATIEGGPSYRPSIPN